MTFPLNRRHQKTVGTYSSITLLEVDVISTIYPHEQTLYTVRMAVLDFCESGLSAGRFAKYSDDRQEHLVVTNMLDNKAATYEAMFCERLDWISQFATESWNFDINVPNLGADAKCTILWTFKSLDDALLFKLTF